MHNRYNKNGENTENDENGGNSGNEKKKRKEKRLPKYIPLTELIELINAPYEININHRLAMKFGAICGLRGNEVVHLIKGDVNLDSLEVRVNRGKGNKDRVVPINPSSMKFIRELGEFMKNMKHEDILFPMKTTSGLTQMVKRYARFIGIERNVNFHMLRHSFAVHSIKAGVNIRTVQMALGHSEMSTTAIYLDLMTEDMKKDYEDHPLPYE